ncbi:unnamed protein product [Acanthoscelides obtectus]|uniref:Uncharacterized protein n=1 Tax=Acanthoscelides obtectus TaxID=200917 RepID=A0A9P0LFJ4_ACAOB|nr:unnamed protein product [Acanthoscelides obtectus]CAK1624555.1 hypothetical protein AOBTE_LOCUS2608 [Acanthoscelides obtectus]
MPQDNWHKSKSCSENCY